MTAPTHQQQVVTVLTGCTKGLGLAMAQQLVTEGGHLITLSRHSQPDWANTAKANGTALTQIQVDLSDSAQTQQAAQEMRQALALAISSGVNSSGGVSARLIHNAGTVQPVAPADQQTDWDAIDGAFAVNITTPIFLTSHFLQATSGCSDRRLMLISSGAGRSPTQGWGVYCATKAAMDRYAEVVSLENHPNTRVTSMAPGVIDTPMQQTIRNTPSNLFPPRQRFEDMHAQGVLASPAETAQRLLAILQSDDYGQTVIDDARNHSH
jgi:NAD(P)-dependent dehydrogenase (short-subunit alcohol dehydrogenase family)